MKVSVATLKKMIREAVKEQAGGLDLSGLDAPETAVVQTTPYSELMTPAERLAAKREDEARARVARAYTPAAASAAAARYNASGTARNMEESTFRKLVSKMVREAVEEQLYPQATPEERLAAKNAPRPYDPAAAEKLAATYNASRGNAALEEMVRRAVAKLVREAQQKKSARKR